VPTVIAYLAAALPRSRQERVRVLRAPGAGGALFALVTLIAAPAAPAFALTPAPAHYVPGLATPVRFAAPAAPTYRADGWHTTTVATAADRFDQVSKTLGALLPQSAPAPDEAQATAWSAATAWGASHALPGLPAGAVGPPIQLSTGPAGTSTPGAGLREGDTLPSIGGVPTSGPGDLASAAAAQNSPASAGTDDLVSAGKQHAVPVAPPGRRVVVAAPVKAVPVATPRATRAPVRGPDIASHQHDGGGVVNWNAAVRGGASFAFVKASEGSGGSGYINPYFAGDISALRHQGVIRGAYHFARPNGTTSAAIVADAVGEANFFVRVAGKLHTAGDLPAVLDLEQDGGLNPAQLSLWAHTWLAATKKLTGRTPLIYTYVDFWRSQMGNSTGFTAYPLWLAHYGVPKPAKVGGWKSYTFWQYSEGAHLAGVNRPVDMSVFNGSQAQLRVLANYKPVAKPAPKPGPVPAAEPAKVGGRIGRTGTSWEAQP